MNLSSKTLQPEIAPRPAILIRSLGWCSLGFLLAFLINNVLTVGFNYPGTIDFLKTPSLTNLLQPLVYAVLFFLAVLWSIKTANISLRKDAKKITAINAYIIRGCFFSVLLIGLIDASIAWLRVEGLLTSLFNESTASALLRSGFIGPKNTPSPDSIGLFNSNFFSYFRVFMACLNDCWRGAINCYF